MTTLMSTHSLQMSAGHLPLFDHLELGIRAGDRLGLIGANGCGKSTLLALLAGERTPQAGRIVQAAACRCEFVAQQLPAELSTLSTRAVLLDALGNDPAAEWQVDKLLDLNGDKQPELIVVVESAGSGRYLSADAFTLTPQEGLDSFNHVEGLAPNEDVIQALKTPRD